MRSLTQGICFATFVPYLAIFLKVRWRTNYTILTSIYKQKSSRMQGTRKLETKALVAWKAQQAQSK